MIRWKLLLINFLFLVLVIILSIYFINIMSSPYDYKKLSSNLEDIKKKDTIEVPKIGKKKSRTSSFSRI